MGGWRWVARAAAPVLVVLASATHAAPAPAAKPELDQIVERYIAWRGGDAFRRDPDDVHEIAELKFFGVTGTLETWHTPDHWRFELHAPGISTARVVTAHGAWTGNLNGQVIATPDAYRYAKRDPQSARALEAKAGDTVTLVGQAQLDGRAWQVVRVSYGDADTYDAFIDPETGELGACRTTEKGQQTLDRFSDWRWVKGVRIAFVTHETGPDGGERVSTATLVDVGARIDPALFARPKPAPQLTYAAGRSSTDWIPFGGLEAGRIALPVTVNGHTATAFFDSAAAGSVLDSSFAADAGFKPLGALPLGGENAVGSGAMIPNVEIALGGATIKSGTVLTTDLRATGLQQPVLIGDTLFYDAVVDIDFPGGRLALRDPATFRPPAAAIAVPLAEGQSQELVPISIEAGRPALFMIDTGFPLAMRISPRLATAQGLPDGRPSVSIVAGDVAGHAAPGEIASLKSLSLGGVRLTNVPVMFSDAWPSATYTDEVQGLLGVGVLSRFRVIIDWSRGRLYLVPGPDATTAPFARDRLGVGWTPEGQARRITGVAPASPAGRAGLKVGDIVDTIDGKPAATVNDVGGWAPGTEVTLVVRGSAAATRLILADYY
jgi:Aspartyl protease/PDZ domain